MIAVDVKKELTTSHGPMHLDTGFWVNDGECVTVFGPSGSGKTTLLRMLAGLMTPDDGVITVNGAVWFDKRKGINKPIMHRRIGYMSQDNTLFAHMTVRQNLEYALDNKKDVSLIDEYLDMVDLRGLSSARPHTLSGGQKQRVSLVRALLRKPEVFLLDEPFSALDLTLRLKMQDDVQSLLERFKIPAIFVTHDLSEIFKLAHRIFILEHGRISRSGRPGEVFGEEALSGKFKMIGTIMHIQKEDVVLIITVQVANNLTKVVATAEEAQGWHVGDRVMVMAKAFNPIIWKV